MIRKYQTKTKERINNNEQKTEPGHEEAERDELTE